jgi:FlaG/FlaF family flagellin (archaellin)
MKNREYRTGEDRKAVSSVIGTVLIVSLTVLTAAVGGTLVTGIGSSFQDVDTPPSAGVEFSYDYQDSSDKAQIKVQDPGNTERLYVRKAGGSFEKTDIVETRGWQADLGDRDGAGSIVNGSKLVNNDTRAGDVIIVDNATPKDDFIVTADKGVGTDAVVLEYWESEDWKYP